MASIVLGCRFGLGLLAREHGPALGRRDIVALALVALHVIPDVVAQGFDVGLLVQLQHGPQLGLVHHGAGKIDGLPAIGVLGLVGSHDLLQKRVVRPEEFVDGCVRRAHLCFGMFVGVSVLQEIIKKGLLGLRRNRTSQPLLNVFGRGVGVLG